MEIQTSRIITVDFNPVWEKVKEKIGKRKGTVQFLNRVIGIMSQVITGTTEIAAKNLQISTH